MIMSPKPQLVGYTEVTFPLVQLGKGWDQAGRWGHPSAQLMTANEQVTSLAFDSLGELLLVGNARGVLVLHRAQELLDGRSNTPHPTPPPFPFPGPTLTPISVPIHILPP